MTEQLILLIKTLWTWMVTYHYVTSFVLFSWGTGLTNFNKFSRKISVSFLFSRLLQQTGCTHTTLIGALLGILLGKTVSHIQTGMGLIQFKHSFQSRKLHLKINQWLKDLIQPITIPFIIFTITTLLMRK